MKKILVALPVEQRHQDKLEAAAPGCAFLYVPAGDVTAAQAASADAIVGNLAPALIAGADRLRLFQLNSAGADAYLKPGILRDDVILCNATGAYSKTVAEHGLAVTLALQKKLPLYRDGQNAHVWRDCGLVTSIADATVLVVGLGDIGLHYARMVKALGATVIGLKRRPGEKPQEVDELYTTDRLDDMLPRADVIFSVLPGTPATTHLYTAERFRRMKDSAIFINCGRGSAVETETLLWALQSGQIAAASVDVTEVEPLPPESPLWEQEKLLLTPHVAGEYHLPETFERIIDIAARNLSLWLEGKEPTTVVDRKTGYKR